MLIMFLSELKIMTISHKLILILDELHTLLVSFTVSHYRRVTKILYYFFSDKLDDDGNELDFECTLSHFGANPKKNDVALKNAFPDLYT